MRTILAAECTSGFDRDQLSRRRPVRLVSASDYEALEAFVRRFASSTPRDGQWQRSYLALQRQARALLGLSLEPEGVSAVFPR